MPDTILVVEDEATVARGLEYGLKAEGFSVVVAPNGKKALEAARSAHPRLVLLDVRLPDMSGFDVCRSLREEGMTLPIIMVTARDEEVDKVLGLELGADDYVVKPFSLRELVSRVRAALRRAYGELASADSPACSLPNAIAIGVVTSTSSIVCGAPGSVANTRNPAA